ncbi:MAG: tyrosine-type recombinase/integrase [Gammaproteobacteria bacterium]
MSTKQKRTPGLVKRGEIWHVDKWVRGRRLCESTGTSDRAEAEKYLARKLEEIRQAEIYGVRPRRTFRQAATKHLNECRKATIADDAKWLKKVEPFIGDLPLDAVHMGTLGRFIEARRAQGVKTRTINHALKVVRHILNLARDEWLDGYGLTWLSSTPKIKLLPEHDLRKPYPLSSEEQDKLFCELPLHLARMCLFKVHTGCREAEVCGLRWNWEIEIPELHSSVFIIPAHAVKNRTDRLVVMNNVARSVIESLRGEHPDHVFTYRGRPISRINNTGWKQARARAGLADVRVHDLKHTFGRRLRAAGVSFEDRQDLLGHKSGRITTHYSAAELSNLIEAANAICGTESRKSPALVLLRGRAYA